MIELHGLWTLPCAMAIARALEPFRPAWIEEPIRGNEAGALARLPATPDPDLRERAAGDPRGLPRGAGARRRLGRDDRRGLVRRPRRGAPDRGHGRCLARARDLARLHRACGLRGLLRALGHPAARELAGDGPGLRSRLVPRDRDRPAASHERRVSPLEGAGLGLELRPEIRSRPDATIVASSD